MPCMQEEGYAAAEVEQAQRALAALRGAILPGTAQLSAMAPELQQQLGRNPPTVAEALAQLARATRERWAPADKAAGEEEAEAE